MSAKSERKAIDKVFILLGLAATAVLLVTSGFAWYGYRFATNQVQTELSAQNIYFPAINSPAIKALPEADQKEINKYAGQQLVDGQQAKVYANHYIKVHLQNIANGKTYAEVSEEAKKDPGNEKLQQQKTTLFQGETLRGILLGSGYSYWVFGLMAKYASIAALVSASIMALLTLLGFRHLAKLK